MAVGLHPPPPAGCSNSAVRPPAPSRRLAQCLIFLPPSTPRFGTRQIPQPCPPGLRQAGLLPAVGERIPHSSPWNNSNELASGGLTLGSGFVGRFIRYTAMREISGVMAEVVQKRDSIRNVGYRGWYLYCHVVNFSREMCPRLQAGGWPYQSTRRRD